MNVLSCHPRTVAPWVELLEGQARFHPRSGLQLSFGLKADARSLRLPAAGPRRPTDELWRHTCFEAFLMGSDRPSYREINLSPSGAWAGYVFQDYRRATPGSALPDPQIRCLREGDVLSLQAHVAVAWLPPGPGLRIGLAAVLECTDGGLTYWALSHPTEQPDFHNPSGICLALER
jgi:hypothetical protein